MCTKRCTVKIIQEIQILNFIVVVTYINIDIVCCIDDKSKVASKIKAIGLWKHSRGTGFWSLPYSRIKPPFSWDSCPFLQGIPGHLLRSGICNVFRYSCENIPISVPLAGRTGRGDDDPYCWAHPRDCAFQHTCQYLRAFHPLLKENDAVLIGFRDLVLPWGVDDFILLQPYFGGNHRPCCSNIIFWFPRDKWPDQKSCFTMTRFLPSTLFAGHPKESYFNLKTILFTTRYLMENIIHPLNRL